MNSSVCSKTMKELREMLKNVPGVEKMDRATLCKLIMARRSNSPIEFLTSEESNTEKLMPGEIRAKIKARRNKRPAAPKKQVLAPAAPAKKQQILVPKKPQVPVAAKKQVMVPVSAKSVAVSVSAKPMSVSAESVSQTTEPIKLGLFKWSNNSCYMDSFFVSIMHKPNNAIANLLLDAPVKYTCSNQKLLKRYSDAIKDKLRIIYNNIQSGNTMMCTELRKVFDKFQRQYIKQINNDAEEINWLSAQQEPRDIFAQMLNHLFNIENNTVIQTVINGAENEPQNLDFAFINIRMMEENDNVRNYVPTYIDEFYNNVSKKMIRNETHVVSSTGLFINVQRGYNMQDKSAAKLTVPDTITLKNGTKLELASIIVHIGTSVHSGHYVVYIKNKDSWYLFDDIVESYEQVENIKSSVYKNVTGLVYL